MLYSALLHVVNVVIHTGKCSELCIGQELENWNQLKGHCDIINFYVYKEKLIIILSTLRQVARTFNGHEQTGGAKYHTGASGEGVFSSIDIVSWATKCNKSSKHKAFKVNTPSINISPCMCNTTGQRRRYGK